LDKFAGSREQSLTGNYRMGDDRHKMSACIIVNTETGEEAEANFFRLVQHLDKNDWGKALKKNDKVAISNIHATYINQVTDDLQPRQKLPKGHYLIKGFSGDKVELAAQEGTVYRIQSNQLKYFDFVRLE